MAWIAGFWRDRVVHPTQADRGRRPAVAAVESERHHGHRARVRVRLDDGNQSRAAVEDPVLVGVPAEHDVDIADGHRQRFVGLERLGRQREDRIHGTGGPDARDFRAGGVDRRQELDPRRRVRAGREAHQPDPEVPDGRVHGHHGRPRRAVEDVAVHIGHVARDDLELLFREPPMEGGLREIEGARAERGPVEADGVQHVDGFPAGERLAVDWRSTERRRPEVAASKRGQHRRRARQEAGPKRRQPPQAPGMAALGRLDVADVVDVKDRERGRAARAAGERERGRGQQGDDPGHPHRTPMLYVQGCSRHRSRSC